MPSICLLLLKGKVLSVKFTSLSPWRRDCEPADIAFWKWFGMIWHIESCKFSRHAGCGDGSLLMQIYNFVCKSTLRGEHLKEQGSLMGCALWLGQRPSRQVWDSTQRPVGKRHKPIPSMVNPASGTISRTFRWRWLALTCFLVQRCGLCLSVQTGINHGTFTDHISISISICNIYIYTH